MGAEFKSFNTPGTHTKKEVEEIFHQQVQEDTLDYGRIGYTGTFAEAPGISFSCHPAFETEDAAEEWIKDHAEKWENALAVKAKRSDGESTWVVGGWFSS